MWLTLKQYADKNGITPQAVYKRIKDKNIPSGRVRKGDNGRVEIKERED